MSVYCSLVCRYKFEFDECSFWHSVILLRKYLTATIIATIVPEAFTLNKTMYLLWNWYLMMLSHWIGTISLKSSAWSTYICGDYLSVNQTVIPSLASFEFWLSFWLTPQVWCLFSDILLLSMIGILLNSIKVNYGMVTQYIDVVSNLSINH